MTIPKIFEPKDCDLTMYPPAMDIKACWANRAQSIFETWLKENGKVVYGTVIQDRYLFHDHKDVDMLTHQALLINIQEIEKKDAVECEHILLNFSMISDPKFKKLPTPDGRCAICGKKLKATWSVVE